MPTTAAARRSSSHETLPTNHHQYHSALRRPKTAPELFRRPPNGGEFEFEFESEQRRWRRMTKLLLNVTVQGSLGPVHVVLSPESKVADLVKAAVETYVKEGRRPLLEKRAPETYELHYSQFSLECLDTEEKLMNLGSRNFFLCSKEAAAAARGGFGRGDCREEEKRMMTSPQDDLMSRPRFMDFFLKFRF